jgi:cellulose synthase/poly-beta-1,6-N-acetylglucosamine synthase-like glycosyltransferase
MMPWWGFAVFAFGANFVLWGLVGVARLTDEHRGRARRRAPKSAPEATPIPIQPPAARLAVADVAVLIAAHNEAVVIQDSLAAIIELVPRRNVFVVSDGSTDDTMALAARLGVHVMATETNLGKAGALAEAITEFGLVDRFAVVMLLDADTRVQPGYFTAALPLFDDPKVVAVAGCVRTAADRDLSPVGSVLIGHRTRIYALGQRALKFGQTWGRVNATHIVPGFASMYRTSVLPEIDMNPPGLVIEDFNMTFEVYQRRLGKVGFSLSAVAVTQDPDTLRDYVRQTRRWALGLWQTVRRHPPSANLFTVMLTVLLIELMTSSLIFLLLPLMFLVLLLPDAVPALVTLPVFGWLHTVVAAHVGVTALVFGILVPDLAMTVLVTLLERRPRLLLCAPFFVFLRILDAATTLATLPMAWLSRSDGRWRSPTRRALPPVAPPQAPPESAASVESVEAAG